MQFLISDIDRNTDPDPPDKAYTLYMSRAIVGIAKLVAMSSLKCNNNRSHILIVEARQYISNIINDYLCLTIQNHYVEVHLKTRNTR